MEKNLNFQNSDRGLDFSGNRKCHLTVKHTVIVANFTSLLFKVASKLSLLYGKGLLSL